MYKLWKKLVCSCVRDWEDCLETFWGGSLREEERQVMQYPAPHTPPLKPVLNHVVAANPCHIGGNALHLSLEPLSQLLSS